MTRPVLAVSALFAVLFIVAADASAQTIADSVGDFSDTQGQNGWYYGYYRRSGDTGGYSPTSDFRPFTTYRTEGSGAPGGWVLDESRFYTGLDSDQQHGNASVSGLDDVEHWAIRRYVAEMSGPVTIAGMTREDNKVGRGDDGTIAKILINGEEVFSRDIEPEDQTATPYAVLATIEAGDTIDFVMLPGDTDYYDCPFFTATIVAVPEPASVGLLATGAIALLARRRRRTR
jgi:hypothetical protein